MKKKVLNLIVITFTAGITSSSSCEDERLADMGRDAGKAFCDCIKSHGKDYCLEELKDEYTQSQYTSAEFVSEFNSTNSCNAVLEVVYSKSIIDGRKIGEYSLSFQP